MKKTLVNGLVLCLSYIVIISCLYFTKSESWIVFLLSVFVFMHVSNTPFAILHEAVHGIASENKFVNYIYGLLASVFFPTSFVLQKVAHTGHHLRNRTDDELYDYYLPNQSRVVRNVWLYVGNLFGFYYISVVLFNLITLFFPWIYRSKFFVNNLSFKLGFGPYVQDIAKQNLLRIWVEIVFAFVFLGFIIYFLDLNVLKVLVCYYSFALHWSVLQYADHAFSSRDVKNGAWNLKVLPIFRWVALNYHYHLTHHQQQTIPWFELPKHVDSSPQPTFWRIYFLLWKGVKKAPPMGSNVDLDLVFKNNKKNV